MNLSAYDKVNNKIDKSKTWIDKRKGILISREIKRRHYYTYVKRYNSELGINEYFLVLLDDNPGDRKVYTTKQDDYGRLKFNISSIAKDSGLINFDNNTNITLLPVEHTDDGDIYKIDI